MKLDGADKRNAVIEKLLTELEDAQFADIMRRYSNVRAQADRQSARITKAMNMIADNISKQELYGEKTLYSKIYHALLVDE